MSQYNLLNKITPKTVIGSIKEVTRDLKESTSVMRVVGIARSMSNGESDYGTWTKFKGDFQATNLLTGEIYRSPNCIMPSIVNGIIESALTEADNNAVEFAFDVTVVPNDTPIGYEFGAIPLVEPKEESPLDALLNSVGVSTPPTLKVEAKPEPKPEPKAEVNDEAKPEAKKAATKKADTKAA